MRIAIDMQAALGRKTGIGVYAARLLEALREIAPTDEFVELSAGREFVMHIDRRLWWQQWEVPRRTRQARAQLLHVLGFDAPRWKPCPVVLTVHDLIGMLFPSNLPPVSRVYWSRWLPFSVRFADRVIADSENTRRDIVRLLRVPAEKICVVPLGVDPAFRPSAEADVARIRHSYELPEQFVLFVGTLEPRKGIDTLITAFTELSGQTELSLVVAGKRGWYWQPLLDQVRAAGLTNRTRLLDYVPDADLPGLYSAATVVAFPSRYEGFGLPPLEAMACGTPVVASNASSLPEVIGEAGLMVPPGDPQALAQALAKVAQDEALRAELARRGRARAQAYTWQRTARETLDVYRSLIRTTHADHG